MSALLRPIYFTLEEYYGIEKASDRHWEYWDSEIVCMSGGTKEHGALTSHIHWLLHGLFIKKGCMAYTEGQAVKCENTPSNYVYPDVSAACNPQFEKHKQVGIEILLNPSILVEVTSNNSISRDHDDKKDGYQKNSSLRDYLIIELFSIRITHWKLVNSKWEKYEYDDLDDVIEFASIDETLSLREIFRVVLFSRRSK